MHGPNEIEAEKPEPWPALLLRQFRDPLIYILLVAAAVTLALRDSTDAGVILAVVLINAAIGFIQELRARKAILGLTRLSAPRAEVIRDGRLQNIFRTGPLTGMQWLIVLAIGSTAIVGGELDKWRNRRAARLLG